MTDQADDLFDNLADGPDVLRGRTPEQMLFDDITHGKNPAISVARYWLDHELNVYRSLMGAGFYVCRRHENVTIRDMIKVNYHELSRELLRYYYQMTRLTAFQGVGVRPAADMDKFLNLVMEHEIIKKTIDKLTLNRLP